MRKHIRLILNHRKMPEKKPAKSCDAGLRCEKSGCFVRSSDAKCLRFGLPLRFGLRCEHPRCQISSDVGRAMRTTKLLTRKTGLTYLVNCSFSLRRCIWQVATPSKTCQNPRTNGDHILTSESSMMPFCRPSAKDAQQRLEERLGNNVIAQLFCKKMAKKNEHFFCHQGFLPHGSPKVFYWNF